MWTARVSSANFVIWTEGKAIVESFAIGMKRGDESPAKILLDGMHEFVYDGTLFAGSRVVGWKYVQSERTTFPLQEIWVARFEEKGGSNDG